MLVTLNWASDLPVFTPAPTLETAVPAPPTTELSTVTTVEIMLPEPLKARLVV